MAYTYDNFVSAATGAGMMDSFTQEDLDRARVNPEFGLSLVKLQQDVNNASTPEQKLLAQEAQNQLRKVYGGAAGQNANQASAQGTGGSYSFDRQEELDRLVGEAINMDPFDYDRSQDPSYANARKEYLREAERARADTIARASAATGGAPSSFAVTAAQQAGDYHLTQLADREAALEQNAYQRYLNDYQKLLSDVDLLTGQREADYAEYLRQQEREQESLNNAINLYNTYKNRMKPEQIRELLGAMGYLTPAVEVFLQGMAAPVRTGGYYAPVPVEEPETDPEKLEQLIANSMRVPAEIAANAAKAVMQNAAQNNRQLTAGDLLWYRGSNSPVR